MATYAPTKVSPVTFESAEGWQPSHIETLDDTGLNQGFVSDMSLKILYFRGQLSGFEIADTMKLPFQSVVQPILAFLKREQMVEIKGAGGLGAGTFIYVITTKGSARAREQLERSAYVGPAPVTWDQYVASVKAQGTRKLRVNPQMIQKALLGII